MKTFFTFFIALALFSGNVVQATTHTVNSAGFTFSPDNLTIKAGDEVNFVLGDTHNAVEVSKATWDANGKTPNGGFGVGFGGGKVTFATSGTYYYVCTPHASMGMKGVIIVTQVTGISENKINGEAFLYPNPASGFFNIQFEVKEHSLVQMELVDYTGRVVRELTASNYSPGTYSERIPLEGLKAGRYLVRFNGAGKRKSLPVTVLGNR